MCSWNCTPTYRGFDSFFGFLNGGEDYYTKEISTLVVVTPWLLSHLTRHILHNHYDKTPLQYTANFIWFNGPFSLAIEMTIFS